MRKSGSPVGEQVVRPADCTCAMAAERYNMVTHYDAGGTPYGLPPAFCICGTGLFWNI